MRDIYRPLLPPNTPWGMPSGLDRGGVLDAPWVGRHYIDAPRPTVPTDSPETEIVPENVFRQPVGFARSDQARQITQGGASGYGQTPGGYLESADTPPLPLHQWRMKHEPGAPYGSQRGGIFQSEFQPRRFPTLPVRNVPLVLTTDYELAGYGSGPDGLGGCGGCGGR